MTCGLATLSHCPVIVPGLRSNESRWGWQASDWRRESGSEAHGYVTAIPGASNQAGVHPGCWAYKMPVQALAVLGSHLPLWLPSTLQPSSFFQRSLWWAVEMFWLPASQPIASAYNTNLSDPVLLTAIWLQLRKIIPVSKQAVHIPWFVIINSYHLSSSIRWVNERFFESIEKNYHSEEFMYTFIYKCMKWLIYDSI